MALLKQLKAEALAWQAQAGASGQALKHCSALELVAKRHGYRNWRACHAALCNYEPAVRLPVQPEQQPTELATKRYKSRDWNFSLDIPKHWNAFPAVSANSPYEIIRFASHESGVQMLIIFRTPYDPKTGPNMHIDFVQEYLSKEGFSNFIISTTRFGSRLGFMLDCDKAIKTGTWIVREYFIFDGTLAYTLGFGANQLDIKNDLYDRIAASFDILNDPLAQ